ncbi:glycerol-3-phosphate dehydrogenase [Aestuariispira insulae]|uniref:Glycerol-3-phosphate dehydrogenase n=1 Tax=Aestuariispira insulae TaxID=1461337 RepID=A0A3D9H455_9PROT|nr:glycerol-3-phosphate dehydrogenase [Aestuariispira insulae]RED44268.1 homodimeric glycerol 3-phosphate dehydrogenase (quinone) [Aestuariispira insulae]
MTGTAPYDIAIIGGGINGAGIARDAAGRGLSVFLCEQKDLACGTSSASTKLIHGGLRYLEHYEFRLVREALKEREVLLRAAPHIIWPLRFILPHVKGLRPTWLIRMGLFLYDHLGGRKLLPASNGVNLKTHAVGRPLKPDMVKAFEYSDCWVQDARLVVLNAMDARDRGADIRVRTECVRAVRMGDHWEVTVRDLATGREDTIAARTLVNAAGPWCTSILGDRVETKSSEKDIRMVKGSHIVVPKLFDHDRCYIFQNPDGRIVFAIPYEGDFTLIGTTDVNYEGDPAHVAISEDEVSYLCELSNSYFEKQITPTDVVWTYSGVRPLYSDGSQDASKVTRDYVLKTDGGDGEAPLLNIFGGKITTYRKLAEHALQKLCGFLSVDDRPWTASAALPGGDIPGANFDKFLAEVKKSYPWLPDQLAYRYARNYGTCLKNILGDATSLAGLGDDLGENIYGAEMSYLVEQEWARTAEDILWRRSKLGLHLSEKTIKNIEDWFAGLDTGAPLTDSRKVSAQ